MRKYLFAVLFGLFITPLFATGIDANATSADCDNATLGQYNGTANLEMDWQPNTINVRWYSDDTQLSVPTNAQTCSYGGDLYLPSAPTKKGYTFEGWEVAKYDFSTLNLNSGGLESFGKGVNSDNTDFCRHGETVNGTWKKTNVTCNEDFTDLTQMEWKAKYNWGYLYGSALCSSLSSSVGAFGSPDEYNNGGQCWCMVTGYTPSGSTIRYSPNNTKKWRFDYAGYGTDFLYCSQYCPQSCAEDYMHSDKLNATGL